MEPVNKNQIINLDIDDLNSEGEGVGRYNGYAVFVKSALPGENTDVCIVKAGKDYGYGKLVKINAPSSERRVPDCPVYNVCGGCSLRHVSYAYQLAYKTKRVSDALARIGGVSGAAVENCVGMEEPFYYRNKAQFPAGVIGGKPGFGFYAKRSHTLIPVAGCLINHRVNDEIINIITEHIIKYNIPVYDETSHAGTIRHISTRVGFKTGEIMVCLCVNAKTLPGLYILINKLKKIPGMACVALNINTKKTNAVMAGRTRAVWGKGYITDELSGISFNISPASFFQVNPIQTEVLYKRAALFLDVRPGDTVIDAYCGIGTISLILAKTAKKVYGIESAPLAVSDARNNAEINKIENVEFITGKTEDVLNDLYQNGVPPEKLILNPARKGCDIKTLTSIGEHKPFKVVYISCNPAALARDVKILTGFGYAFIKALPIDCFAYSAHIETVVLLEKEGYIN